MSTNPISISYLPHPSGLRRLVMRMDPEFAAQFNGTHARKGGSLQNKRTRKYTKDFPTLSTGRDDRPVRRAK